MNTKVVFLCSLLLATFFAFSQDQHKKPDSITVHKKEKDKKFVGIPTINYSNSFGATFGAFGMLYYDVKKTDTISPLSSSGFIGSYSANDTWFVVQINKFYLKEDKLRIKTAIGGGSINFQTYVDWPLGIEGFTDLPTVVEENGEFVDYNTTKQFVYFELLRKVYQNLYIGGRAVYSHAYTEFELDFVPTEELSQFGIGFSSEFDSRDSQFSPKKGNHANIKTLTFSEKLGSTNGYTRINLVYNHYFPMKDRNTLLTRFYSNISTGDVPFAGQNVVGRDDLRGYSNGKYRGEQVYSTQAEYRHWFSEKWGYVAFGGVATAINDASDLQIGSLLPAVGAGIRFLAIPSKKISIGIDVAVGKDDWGLYFRIGEAFTR